MARKEASVTNKKVNVRKTPFYQRGTLRSKATPRKIYQLMQERNIGSHKQNKKYFTYKAMYYNPSTKSMVDVIPITELDPFICYKFYYMRESIS